MKLPTVEENKQRDNKTNIYYEKDARYARLQLTMAIDTNYH